MKTHQRLARHYLVFWTTLTFLFAWLPLLRCLLDGDTYEWGTTHFGMVFRGAGLEGDLWFLFVKLAIGLASVYGICRYWRPGLALLLAVVGLYLLDSLASFLRDPDGMVFHGDTLGVELNVGLAAVIISGLAVLAGILLATAWSRLPSHAPPSRANRRTLLILAALLPLQFVLLRFGEPHGTTDAVGVIITILQWIALPWALRFGAPGRVPGGVAGDRQVGDWSRQTDAEGRSARWLAR